MTEAGVKPLEAFIYNGMMNLAGDPLFLGLIVLGFFLGFVFLQRVGFENKLAIGVPAAILALAFIPQGQFIVIILIAVIMFLGLIRLITR